MWSSSSSYWVSVTSRWFSPKFIQLYIYDTANEVQNRIQCIKDSEESHMDLDPTIVNDLIKMLDLHNPLAKKFRMARERLANTKNEEFIIRLIGAKEGDTQSTIGLIQLDPITSTSADIESEPGLIPSTGYWM
jgi:hypothetical protein